MNIKTIIILVILIVLSGCIQRDTVAPVITIKGDNPATTILGQEYNDAGATAVDAVDGIVSCTTDSDVDIYTQGEYDVHYYAVDKAGNEGKAERLVVVEKDDIAPVIVLNGEETITLPLGSTYIELGATVTDNIDKDIQVIINGEVNTNIAGTYMITYTATDSSSNNTTIYRYVVVQ